MIPASFDETQRWIANNGFAVVIATMLLLGFFWVLRVVLGDLAKRVSSAVTYFTTKLDMVSDRQEKSLDRLDDRLSMMTDNSIDGTTRLTAALNEIASSQREQAAAMAALNESNRILLTFMTQNMANVQAHRAVVEPIMTGGEGPAVGVMKPVGGTS
jgi:predicted PurR-regulated permease PerM